MSVKEAQAQVAEFGADCDSQMTTMDMNVCQGLALALEEERMDQYFKLAQARVGPDAQQALAELAQSQSAWGAYATAECAVVSRQFEGGSIQGVMGAGCRIELTRARTHTIWKNSLQYMDSTPPPVPEPLKAVAEERSAEKAG